MNWKRNFPFLAYFVTIAIVGIAVASPLTFSGRLFGAGDIANWESLGSFFRNHLEFKPYPWIEFHSDQFLFPFGFTNVMQTWGFEREYWNAVLSTGFGDGPWLQIYFLISLGITIGGLFLIFRNMLGFSLAAFFSLLPVVANPYLFFRYPGHLNIAVAHWAILGIALDFYLCRVWFLRTRVSLVLIALRLVLLGACLGLDLGYVAGYSFTSFFFTAVWILFSAWRAGSTETLFASLKLPLQSLAERLQLAALLLAGGVLAFLYLPLLADVLLSAQPFSMPQISNYWVNPLHLLHPWIPGIDPVSMASAVTHLLRDHPEGPAEFTPGLSFFVVAVLGCVFLFRQKSLKPLAPFVLLFVICVAHHPSNFNLLNVLPWFKYNRVPRRSTLFFPVLLTLPLVQICEEGWASKFLRGTPLSRFLGAVGLVLFILETGTQFYWHARTRTAEITPELTSYLKIIKQAPGAALLDFPFCVSGGNGVATDTYCPSFAKLSALGGFSAFHGKKVLDIYAGRLHPSQIQPLESAGFAMLTTHFFEPHGLDKCLSEDEMSFLDRFYTLNDFSGMQIMEEYIPDLCRKMIYARFGMPVASAALPLAGGVAFVQKDERRRKQLDPEQGKRVVFENTQKQEIEQNLLLPRLNSGVSVVGLDTAPESSLNDAQARVSRSICVDISLFSPAEENVALLTEFENRVPNQTTTLLVNDKQMASEKWERVLDKRSASSRIKLVQGANKISICHAKRMNFKTLFYHECSLNLGNCIAQISRIYKDATQNKSWAGVYSVLKISRDPKYVK